MRPRSFLTRWWIDLPIALKGLLVLALPLVTLAVTLAIRIPYNRQQEKTTAVLGRAASTRDTAQELLVLLLDVQTGTQGYVLTSDRSFLAPVESAHKAIPARLERLAGLLSDEQDGAHYLSLSTLVGRELDLATRIIGLVEEGALATDAAVVQHLADEKRVMDEIREAVGMLRVTRDELVAESQEELARLRRLLAPIILMTFFGGLGGALVAAWLFATGIATRVTALERNADRLARGERLRFSVSRGFDEIGSLDRALRRASLLLRTRHRELRSVNAELQRTVHEQALLNRELEAFSYSVSHDLRAPLRSIDGFAQALREDWGERLDETAQDYLSRVRNAAQRMGRLIDDLLKLSTLTRAPVQRMNVDLTRIAREVSEELTARNPTRPVTWAIADGLRAWCDPSLARIVIDNLLGNAWKFTSKTEGARIEFYAVPGSRPTEFAIRDNGAGFDMKFVEKLFSPFQRLHAEREFPGIGIGLATVQRIVHKHGGRVRTRGEIGRGATFEFTLEPPDAAMTAA